MKKEKKNKQVTVFVEYFLIYIIIKHMTDLRKINVQIRIKTLMNKYKIFNEYYYFGQLNEINREKVLLCAIIIANVCL